MISSIEIRGLGVIDRASIDLGPGLTVFTGETGAGKTMVLTSLGLLLGGRADPALVRQGYERAEVDGVFTVPDSHRHAAEEAGALVEDDELIVSRTVSAQGRSRAHLGGRTVPAGTLNEIVSPFVTIHGQADQFRLTSTKAQRDLLDSYGGDEHARLLGEYRDAWREAVDIKKRLDEALRTADERDNEIDELTEAIEQIDRLGTYEGEDEDLRLEARRLMNVEDLRRIADTAVRLLEGDDDEAGASALIRHAAELVSSGKGIDEELSEFADRLHSLAIDADTLIDDVRSYGRSLNADTERLAEVHVRRAELKRLLDGRATDAQGLLRWYDAAVARRDALTEPGADPDTMRARLTQAQEGVLAAGERLTTSRRRLAAGLSSAIDVELGALSMPDAHVEIAVEASKPSSSGCDEVSVLLKPHPSAAPRPLGQGASGGELSRIMLAIEVVLSGSDSAQTFVFDEVDAGIGGRAAVEVGARLSRLAQTRQVIVVTHLAQVASFATRHFVVSKADGATTVVLAVGQDREAELTRMMGGDSHLAAARRHAMEVLSSYVPQSQG